MLINVDYCTILSPKLFKVKGTGYNTFRTIEGMRNMPLIHGKALLKEAKEKGYALGAFNATTLEGIIGIIEGAQRANRPVFLQYAEVHQEYVDLERIGPIMVDCARKATVPVVVHYDHGKKTENIRKALEMGFTSVMFDGADRSFDENIRQTKNIVEMAKAYDASVEGELGTIGGTEGDFSHSAEDALYTNPLDARIFVEKTGVDQLAVAYGTAHGLYKERPKLDFVRLKEIAERVPVPLVMHGGSGLTEDEFAESIRRGICKINYYSDLANKSAKVIFQKLSEMKQREEEVYLHDLSLWAREVVAAEVKDRLNFFALEGRER